MEELEKLSKKELIEIIKDFSLRIKDLESRLNQNSSNSSRPPSSDPLWKRAERKTKKRFNFERKPGGQKGHKGHKLNKFEKVDQIVEYTFDCCPSCKSNNVDQLNCQDRQVLDIPPAKMEVTAHRFYNYQCNGCGQEFIDDQINRYQQEVQYGERIKSLVVYLNVYQLVPYKRLVELIETIYQHRISQGSISNFCKQMSTHLKPFVYQTKSDFTKQGEVVHSDETGVVVDSGLHWTHVYSNDKKTLLFVHQKRGRQAIEDIGILPRMKGTIIHDRFSSYFGYKEISHGLCNAHILRDIKSSQENNAKDWLEEIKKLLINAKKSKDRGKLKKNSYKFLKLKYERILRKQRVFYHKIEEEKLRTQKHKGGIKKSPDHRLFSALWKYRNEILLFVKDENVPFDNNQAERDLRMLKVKMKVSNLFKSLHWAQVHLDIRSYISTIRKNQKSVLDCLIAVLKDPNFAINLAV